MCEHVCERETFREGSVDGGGGGLIEGDGASGGHFEGTPLCGLKGPLAVPLSFPPP